MTAQLDRATARALSEAGYMPTAFYIEAAAIFAKFSEPVGERPVLTPTAPSRPLTAPPKAA